MSSVFPSFYTQNRISEYRKLTNLTSSSWPPPSTSESAWSNSIKAQTVEEVASLGILVVCCRNFSRNILHADLESTTGRQLPLRFSSCDKQIHIYAPAILGFDMLLTNRRNKNCNQNIYETAPIFLCA